MTFFLVSGMVLGLLYQLQIFLKSCLIELLGLLSKAFGRVWHASLLHKLRAYGISGQIFGLISTFLSNMRLWVVLDGKSSQEYPVNA